MKTSIKKIAYKLMLLGLITTHSFLFSQTEKKHKKLTVEQKTELQLKKMTLHLDLTKSQQDKLRPVLLESALFRKSAREKRTELIKTDSNSRYEAKMAFLDQQIKTKGHFKNILSPEQMIKWEKMKHRSPVKRKMKNHRKRNHHTQEEEQ